MLLVLELLLGIQVSSPTITPLDGYSLCSVRTRSTHPSHPTIDIWTPARLCNKTTAKFLVENECGTQSNIWGHSARCVCATLSVFGWLDAEVEAKTGDCSWCPWSISIHINKPILALFAKSNTLTYYTLRNVSSANMRLPICTTHCFMESVNTGLGPWSTYDMLHFYIAIECAK